MDEARIQRLVKAREGFDTCPLVMLRQYCQAKVTEWEDLRHQYEQQIEWLQAEVRRMGGDLDNLNMKAPTASE